MRKNLCTDIVPQTVLSPSDGAGQSVLKRMKRRWTCCILYLGSCLKRRRFHDNLLSSDIIEYYSQYLKTETSSRIAFKDNHQHKGCEERCASASRWSNKMAIASGRYGDLDKRKLVTHYSTKLALRRRIKFNVLHVIFIHLIFIA